MIIPQATQGLKHYFSQHSTDLKLFFNFLPFIFFIVFFVCFQRLYHVKETHSIFVTGLEFLPMSEATRAIVGSQDFSMLSVSADNTIKIHHMPERSRYLYCHCKWSIAMSPQSDLHNKLQNFFEMAQKVISTNSSNWMLKTK